MRERIVGVIGAGQAAEAVRLALAAVEA